MIILTLINEVSFHPIVTKFAAARKFVFWSVTEETNNNIVNNLPTKKAASGDTPLHLL